MLNAWKFLLDGQQVLASTSTQCLLQTTQKRHHPLIQYNKYNLHCSEKPTTNPYPYRPPLTNPQKPTHQTPTKKAISHYPTTKTQHTNPPFDFFSHKKKRVGGLLVIVQICTQRTQHRPIAFSVPVDHRRQNGIDAFRFGV